MLEHATPLNGHTHIMFSGNHFQYVGYIYYRSYTFEKYCNQSKSLIRISLIAKG